MFTTDNKAQADHMTMILGIMQEDGVTEAFATASQEQQVEMVRAYSQEAVRRVNKMASTYLTNPAAKEAANSAILAELKQEAA